MDFICTNVDGKENGYLSRRTSIDLEIGSYLSTSRNDFEITMPASEWETVLDEGSLFYDDNEDSEFGGRIQGKTSDTSAKTVILYGFTWRGLISKQYIEPPAGQSHYKARGDANAFLRDILDDYFDGLIVGPSEECGIEINRDIRYVNKLEAIEKTLSDAGLKLKVRTEKYSDINGSNKRKVIVSAVRVENKSENMEYSQDYGYNLVAKDIKNGYNHVICLGQGELTERTVIHLYRLKNGVITQDESLAIKDGITGINRRTMLYDYSSVESTDELIQGGIDQLNQNCDTKSLEISNVDDVDISDIVGARDQITGIYMQKKIISKVLTGYTNNIKIQYKVGD